MNTMNSVTGVGRSPFAAYPGEQLIAVKTDDPLRIPLPLSDLSADERTVLSAINDSAITTAHLLYCRLTAGITANRIYTVLDRLWRLELINTHRFATNEGGANYFVYSVSEQGSLFLRNAGITTRGTYRLSSRLNADSEAAKRYLAAQQYAVMQHDYDPERCSFASIVCEERSSEKSDRIFRAGALIHTDATDLLVQGVRLVPGWEDKVMSKLVRMEHTLQVDTLNQTLRSPIVVLVAEDQYHAEELYQLLWERNPRCSFEIRIANDADVYARRNEYLHWKHRNLFIRLVDHLADILAS